MKTFVSILGGLTLASAAHAALVVDLSGNWNTSTSSNINYNLGTADVSVTDTVSYRRFDSTPLLANGAAGSGGSYIGPSLYGAITQYNEGGFIISNNLRAGSADALNFTSGASTVSGAAGELNFLIIVKKENFINGLSAGNVGFNSTSTFGFTASTWSASSKTARAVVQNNGTWYISQSANTSASSNEAKPILTNASTALWSVWDPTSSIRSASLSFASTVAGSTFTNIQAVGIWVALFETTGGTNPNVAITSIQIDAVAIPEPSASVAIAGFGVLGTVVLHRRRRA
jgi:hypothetical protein